MAAMGPCLRARGPRTVAGRGVPRRRLPIGAPVGQHRPRTSDPMRVLWICGSRIVGGAERVNIRLAELLRARGHEVEVLCPAVGDLGGAVLDAGLRCHHGPLGSAVDFRAAMAIRRVLGRGYEAALVTTPDEWVWACLAKRMGGARLVLARYMALPLARGVSWLANRRADAIIAVSGAVRDALLAGGAIDAGRVHVLPHPMTFDPRERPPEPSERRAARSALALPSDGRWLGFFGGFSEGKGIGDVIAAVRIASRKVGRIELLVTDRGGRGDAGGWRAALGDAGRLHFLGDLPYGRVAVAMTAADAVVVATRSHVREASSLVLHEALATGTPAVAYATGGIPELIGGDGVAGLLATPDDPVALGERIARILSDAELAGRLAAEGIRRIRERCDADRLVELHEKLLAGTVP